MELIYNGEKRLSISFFIFEKYASKHWGTLKKNRSNFEQRERKYANTWVVAAVRVVRNHSKNTSFVFILYL